MIVRYTIHARERLVERDVTEADVELILANYHTMYHDRKGNPNYVGTVGERRVRIVVAAGVTPPLVITIIVSD